MTDEVAEVPDVKIDVWTRRYLKAKAAHTEAQAVADGIEADMKLIKSAIKDCLLAAGTKSAKTDYGTVSLIKSTRYFTNDWPNFDTWIVENNLPPSSMFEHRLAQKNMAEFLEQNPGVVPPGLNSETEFSVRVSKPTKS